MPEAATRKIISLRGLWFKGVTGARDPQGYFSIFRSSQLEESISALTGQGSTHTTFHFLLYIQMQKHQYAESVQRAVLTRSHYLPFSLPHHFLPAQMPSVAFGTPAFHCPG